METGIGRCVQSHKTGIELRGQQRPLFQVKSSRARLEVVSKVYRVSFCKPKNSPRTPVGQRTLGHDCLGNIPAVRRDRTGRIEGVGTVQSIEKQLDGTG